MPIINNHKLIFAGYGGQGMLLCGQILANAAMDDGFHVTWLPTYGPEMRGGAAACYVMVSKNPISSPVTEYATAIAATSQPAFDKYHENVSENGCLFYNSDIVAPEYKRPNIAYYPLPLSTLAEEAGNPRITNMILLGAFNRVMKCVNDETLENTVRGVFGTKKAELADLNAKALAIGASYVNKAQET